VCLSKVKKGTYNHKTCVIFGNLCILYIDFEIARRVTNKTIKKINSKGNKIKKFSVGLKNSPKIRKIGLKWLRMRPIEVLFFGSKYFFHKAICITEKMRPYLKSLVKI